MLQPDSDADPVDEYRLTVSHVAQQLKKSEATIRRMYDSGELPGVRRSNGERWFRQSDVDAVQQHRREQFARARGVSDDLEPLDAA